MYHSQGVALVRRAIVSKALFLKTPRFLPIAIHLAPTLRTTVTSPHNFTSIRCNSSKSTEGFKPPNFLRAGDWACGNCQAHNFRSRTMCFKCHTSVTEGRIFYQPGNWHCPVCNVAVMTRGSLSPSCSCRYLLWGRSRWRYLLAMFDSKAARV
jgi:hypothetical protein